MAVTSCQVSGEKIGKEGDVAGRVMEGVAVGDQEKKSPVSWFEHSLLQTQSQDSDGLARITEYINSLFH